MIRSTVCHGSPNLWTPSGRHCPSRHPRLPSQGNILHLAQRKNPRARVCCLLGRLNSELLLDDSMEYRPRKPAVATDECKASVQVDASLLRFVVGKGAKVKAKIEKDTTTCLQIPSEREAKHGSCIVVKGASQVQVDDAVSKIHRVLEEAVESPYLDYSHFISLPLALHSDLMVQVAKFHDSVMAMLPANEKDSATGKSSSQRVEGEGVEIEKDAAMCVDNSVEPKRFENSKVTCLSETNIPTEEEILAHAVEQVVGLGESGAEAATTNLGEPGKEDNLDSHEAEASNEEKDHAESSTLLTKRGHGIEESIFIKPTTLHLTVLMLKLWNKERVANAAKVLQGLKSKLLEALDHRPVAVRLKGLECMKGSPAKAHVLYARVEDVDKDSRLLCACKVIKDAFVEAGLVSEKDKNQEIKLHATLMNTSHRKRKRGKMFGRRIPFDARPILSLHGSEDWGDYNIIEAHLSERFAFDQDGYYHCCASVKLPAVSL